MQAFLLCCGDGLTLAGLESTEEELCDIRGFRPRPVISIRKWCGTDLESGGGYPIPSKRPAKKNEIIPLLKGGRLSDIYGE